ncbi:abortive infection family protein, partial [Enterococcus faecalis]|uniref:abortive infection family protein n=1 Tax=Enterococcus faecalis TaxID=1351 RepID=UPI0027D9CC6F
NCFPLKGFIVIPPAIFFYYSTLFDSRFKTLQQNQMRNSQGDAHAHGSRRIIIKEEEAILAANSSLILCEYLFTKYKMLNEK